jgi:ATP-dependent Clp protease adaptor protein ClpS
MPSRRPAGEGRRARLAGVAGSRYDAVTGFLKPRRPMSETANPTVTPKSKPKTRVQKPPLWKVILLNDDFTPRDFVVTVLKAVFRMNEAQAYKVMMTAHQKGACVIAVYTRDVAETKAKEATDMGKAEGYPLYFTTEKES